MKAVKKVSIALDEESLALLDGEVARTKSNRSQVVRACIAKAMLDDYDKKKTPLSASPSSTLHGPASGAATATKPKPHYAVPRLGEA